MGQPGDLNINVLEANPGSNNLKIPLESDVRKDLLQSEDTELVNNIDKCPTISLKIQRVETKALIGTGNGMTCNPKTFLKITKTNFKIVKFYQL